MTLPRANHDLTGKIAIVTGGSRGIGEQIARTFAAHGAHVIVASRKGADCETVANAIVKDGGKAEAVACHVGDLDAIAALYAHVDDKHGGRIDIVVNNAATSPHFGPIVSTDPGAFQKTVDVNLRGAFFMTTHAAQRMEKTGGGVVINIASVNGRLPGLWQGIYSITKAALIAMTEAFAKELAGTGIRVNAILPGLTDTKLAAGIIHNEQLSKSTLEHIPMARVAQPSEMAGAALFLASPASSYVTGASLTVDGGYLLA
jgi:NAD(P)-dependent dehydrogenase (short-subunit alcohol dehydrogenase family)